MVSWNSALSCIEWIAELLFYPTAIGSEPILDTDSCGRGSVRCKDTQQQILFQSYRNRYGLEEVSPSAENGGQSSSLDFYGSSFMTDETGAILEQSKSYCAAKRQGASERLQLGTVSRGAEMYQRITD